MTLARYVLTATVTVPAGVSSYAASGPATTVSGTTVASPGALVPIASEALATGTFLLSWTATLQTAAAAGDANNFGLYSGSTLLATSVNAGALGSYPQAAVNIYLGAGATIAVQTIAAGSAGSVYNASLTVTPLTSGDNKGAVAWDGAGSPPGWSPGPFPVTFLAGHAAVAGQRRGPVRHALSQSAGLDDGTDNVGHAAIST